MIERANIIYHWDSFSRLESSLESSLESRAYKQFVFSIWNIKFLEYHSWQNFPWNQYGYQRLEIKWCHMYRSKTERCWICVTLFIETREELKQLSLGGMCFFLEGITFEDLCSKSPPFKGRKGIVKINFFMHAIRSDEGQTLETSVF